MKVVNVVNIVKLYLESNGYDGLYSDECACLKDDLEPCGMMSSTCEAGYLQKDPDPEYDFVIGAHKPEDK
jgi:hypothetical protein